MLSVSVLRTDPYASRASSNALRTVVHRRRRRRRRPPRQCHPRARSSSSVRIPSRPQDAPPPPSAADRRSRAVCRSHDENGGGVAGPRRCNVGVDVMRRSPRALRPVTRTALMWLSPWAVEAATRRALMGRPLRPGRQGPATGPWPARLFDRRLASVPRAMTAKAACRCDAVVAAGGAATLVTRTALVAVGVAAPGNSAMPRQRSR